jgi:hypothetical protein
VSCSHAGGATEAENHVSTQTEIKQAVSDATTQMERTCLTLSELKNECSMHVTTARAPSKQQQLTEETLRGDDPLVHFYTGLATYVCETDVRYWPLS